VRRDSEIGSTEGKFALNQSPLIPISDIKLINEMIIEKAKNILDVTIRSMEFQGLNRTTFFDFA
jgi:hypothetical protein